MGLDTNAVTWDGSAGWQVPMGYDCSAAALLSATSGESIRMSCRCTAPHRSDQRRPPPSDDPLTHASFPTCDTQFRRASHATHRRNSLRFPLAQLNAVSQLTVGDTQPATAALVLLGMADSHAALICSTYLVQPSVSTCGRVARPRSARNALTQTSATRPAIHAQRTSRSGRLGRRR